LFIVVLIPRNLCYNNKDLLVFIKQDVNFLWG